MLLPILLSNYFHKIELDLDSIRVLITTHPVEALNQIYHAHMMVFPYSSFELREAGLHHPVERASLTFFDHERVMTRGGYCYQINNILYSALTQLGFSARFCEARSLLGKPVNDPSVLSLPISHVVLVVTIGGQDYLLEPAMGMKAPRFPILVSDSKDEIIVQYKDKFRIYKQDGVFVLEKMLKDSWITVMQTALEETSEEKLRLNLLRLERTLKPMPIRDAKILIALLTPKGSKSLYWDLDSNKLKFMQQEEDEFTQRILMDWTEACVLLDEEFNIKGITPEQLHAYCSESHWPHPKKAWTIDFPITSRDLEEMKSNLTL